MAFTIENQKQGPPFLTGPDIKLVEPTRPVSHHQNVEMTVEPFFTWSYIHLAFLSASLTHPWEALIPSLPS